MMAQMPSEISIKVSAGKSFLAVMKAEWLVNDALEDRPWDEHLLALKKCVDEILADLVVG